MILQAAQRYAVVTFLQKPADTADLFTELTFSATLLSSWKISKTQHESKLALNVSLPNNKVDLLVFCEAATVPKLPSGCVVLQDVRYLDGVASSNCYYRVVTSAVSH